MNREKGKIGLFIGIGFLIVGLTGCAPPEITYQGKTQPIDTVEEILADMLEMENPNLDLNVSITQESE
jgi:hypothetical protein